MAVSVAEIPAKDQGDDFDSTARRPVKQTLLRSITERYDELTEKVGDASLSRVSLDSLFVNTLVSHIRYIGRAGVKNKCPRQRVGQGLLQLIQLEVFIANPLLVDAHTLNRESAVLFAKPSSVELIVWHHEEEDTSDHGSQEASNEEDDLPGSNCGAVEGGATGNAISYQATKDLRKTVEAEPDTHSCALLSLCVPLLKVRPRS